MTVKGKRAESLRKITLDEARAGANSFGGVVDESFDVEAVHAAVAGTGADLTAFDAFFAPRIGRYRAALASTVGRPTVADELTFTAELMDAIEQVRLRVANLPVEIDCSVNLICNKARGELFFNFAKRVDDDLRLMWMLLAGAARDVEGKRGTRSGRHPHSARDLLLHDVAVWLSAQGAPTKQLAAEGAAACLRAVGVDTPADPKKVREMVRRVEAAMAHK